MTAYLRSCGSILDQEHPLAKARREIWDALSGISLNAMLLQGAKIAHLGTTPELLEFMTLQLPAFIEPYGLTVRAGCHVGKACSVEDDPSATIVNSKLNGAGVVSGGSVVEHCLLEGDGWEVGAGCLMSGVRSVPADHRLRLRNGMCFQQTSLSRTEQKDGGSVLSETELSETELSETARVRAGSEETKNTNRSFVLSIFGAADDIKAHYTETRAKVCGASWSSFFKITGTTADDIWPGIAEWARTLWSAKLFPFHESNLCWRDKNPADYILWMQDIQDMGGDPGTMLESEHTDYAAMVDGWRSKEKFSFKDIIMKADPAGEFRWRRRLVNSIHARQEGDFEDKLGGGGGR